MTRALSRLPAEPSEQAMAVPAQPEPRPPTSLGDQFENEIRYGRDQTGLQIFVSSRMGSTLDLQRELAAATINRLDMHRAWWWERDAPAGIAHSVNECIQYAGASDGIVLLIAGRLSDIIYAEYGAAKAAGAERYVFIRKGARLPQDVKDFIAQERQELVTRSFQNDAELESHLYQSLQVMAVRSMRERVIERRRAQGGRHAYE